MEAFATAILDEISTANGDLRKALDGASPEALNWRPTREETNSIYVIAAHMIGVQRVMVSLSVKATIQRDRAEEFRASGDSAELLLGALSNAEREVTGWLEQVDQKSLSETRTYLNREITVARCLAMVARHLGEHAGHVGLTRQLWEQRNAES